MTLRQKNRIKNLKMNPKKIKQRQKSLLFFVKFLIKIKKMTKINFYKIQKNAIKKDVFRLK